MKHSIITCWLILFGFMASAQNQTPILTDTLTWDAFTQHPNFSDHFQPDLAGYEKYTPQELVIKDLLIQYKMLIFLGTWCEDSQTLLPEFLKYLFKLGGHSRDVTLYGLDETKSSIGRLEDTYKVHFVPTIIFIDKNTQKEKGRITEHVKNSLAEDLHAILNP